MVTFSDIFKKSFIEQFSSGEVLTVEFIFLLAIALFVGLCIFMVYYYSYNGPMYSHSFNASLVVLTLLSAMIIYTITSNIVLSLGMVGALSIVRFRTAVKDTLDLVYMFWAIIAGISIGANRISIAVIGSIFVAVTLILLSRFKTTKSRYVLVAVYDKGANHEVQNILNDKNIKINSKTVNQSTIELTAELSLKNSQQDLKEFDMIEGMKNYSIVGYNQEI